MSKFVLSFGEDKQEVPDSYVLESFQEFISEKDYLEKTYPNVGEKNRKEYFESQKTDQDVKSAIVNSLTVAQLEKLKKLFA